VNTRLSRIVSKTVTIICSGAIARGVITLGVIVLMTGCASDTFSRSRDAENHAMELYNSQQYADAAGAFHNMVRSNPRDYRSYYHLGNCYTQMNQWQKAIQSYHSGLDVMGTTLQGKADTEFRQKILNGLASAIAKSDQRDIELASLEKQAASGTAEDIFVLAKVYAYRGDADMAIETYSRAALRDPSSFYIQKEYGLYLERFGQKDRARMPLRNAYAMNSNDQEVADALRRVGVVPGPSLKSEDQLAKPIVPKGPIPPIHFGGNGNQPTADAPTAPMPGATPPGPRD
jgi:tetratricopeptide (TPR) repeat protein